MTQAAVSRDLGVSTQKLGNWTRGDHYPEPWFVTRFCDRYGVTMDYLFRGVVPGVKSQALAGVLFAAEEAERAAFPEPVGQVRDKK